MAAAVAAGPACRGSRRRCRPFARTALASGRLTRPLRALPTPLSVAAYAGHTALSLLFPWRWARLDKALKPLIADLPADVRREGEAAGRAAATAVVKQRRGLRGQGRGQRDGPCRQWGCSLE